MVLESSHRTDDVVSKIAEEYSWEKSEDGLPLRFVLRNVCDYKGSLSVGIWTIREAWEGMDRISDGDWFIPKQAMNKDHEWIRKKAEEIWSRDHGEYGADIHYYIIPEKKGI
jgi:hypothetical protein